MIDSWDNFLLGQVGASAALLGLLFVGVSLNLAKILTYPQLPGRAFLALLLLLGVLIVGMLLLIPQQSMSVMALEVLVVGVALAFVGVRVEVRTFSSREHQTTAALTGNLLMLAAAIVPYFVSGALLATGNFSGMNWLAVAAVFSTLKATLDAWVLLVEINR